jgi:hypothetical protein
MEERGTSGEQEENKKTNVIISEGLLRRSAPRNDCLL